MTNLRPLVDPNRWSRYADTAAPGLGHLAYDSSQSHLPRSATRSGTGHRRLGSSRSDVAARCINHRPEYGPLNRPLSPDTQRWQTRPHG